MTEFDTVEAEQDEVRGGVVVLVFGIIGYVSCISLKVYSCSDVGIGVKVAAAAAEAAAAATEAPLLLLFKYAMFVDAGSQR